MGIDRPAQVVAKFDACLRRGAVFFWKGMPLPAGDHDSLIILVGNSSSPDVRFLLMTSRVEKVSALPTAALHAYFRPSELPGVTKETAIDCLTIYKWPRTSLLALFSKGELQYRGQAPSMAKIDTIFEERKEWFRQDVLDHVRL